MSLPSHEMNEVWPRIYVWPKANRPSFPGPNKEQRKPHKHRDRKSQQIWSGMVDGGLATVAFSFEAAAETLPRPSGPLSRRPGLSGQDSRANRQNAESSYESYIMHKKICILKSYYNTIPLSKRKYNQKPLIYNLLSYYLLMNFPIISMAAI